MNLHSAIMNLPCDVPEDYNHLVTRVIYKEGHKAARHAAAELAIQADKVIERVVHERQALADAIYEAAIKGGIANSEAPVEGPHLIMFCQDMAECLKTQEAMCKEMLEIFQWMACEAEGSQSPLCHPNNMRAAAKTMLEKYS